MRSFIVAFGFALSFFVLLNDLNAAGTDNLPPGTKVIVDFGGKNEGEIVEQVRPGLYKVRIKRTSGRESTITVPDSKIELSGGKAGDAKRPAGKAATNSSSPRTRAAVNPGENPKSATSSTVPSTRAPSPSPPPKLKGIGAKDKDLQGMWLPALYKVDGNLIHSGDDILVFNGETFECRDGKMRFDVDLSKEPKQIDLDGDKTKFEGVYSVKDDVLLLVIRDKAKGARPATTTTEKGDGVQNFMCRRLPEAEFEGLWKVEIPKFFDAAVAKLEADEFEDAFVFLAPSPFGRPKLTPDDVDKGSTVLKAHKKAFIATFKALRDRTPQISLHPFVATFNLKGAAVAKDFPFSVVNLSWQRKRWFFDAR